MRGFLEISQNKLPKRAFRARLPTIFIEKASKTIVSCEASSKFHRTRLPKRAFRTRLLTIFTEKASKTIVSCEASYNFDRGSFQNERFARCFLEISQKKLAKSTFRARLLPNFTEEASKMIVSCEASDNFHRKSSQRNVRGFFEISQNKLPKRTFRAMLPTIFTEKAPKRIVSCEASKTSSKFHRTILPKRTFRAMLPTISTEFAFRHSFVQSTRRILREGSSSKSKMCVSLQRRAIQNFKMHVLLQRRAQKCMNPAHDVRGNPRHTKISILPQFRTSDQHEVTRGFTVEVTNLHFTTVLDVR